MALANYTDLVTAVQNWSKRTDLSTLIPDFITLAEQEINGALDIRAQDTYSILSTVASTETVAVPTDIINTRALVVNSTTPNVVLQYKSPDQLHRDAVYADTGTPRAFTVIGSYFYLTPIPDAVYTMECYYKGRVPSLTSGSPTNYLITTYPDIYLFGTLMKLSEYIKDKDGFAWYQQKFTDAMTAANRQDWYSGSTMRVKADVS